MTFLLGLALGVPLGMLAVVVVAVGAVVAMFVPPRPR